jgi:radical SAM superfamily enzyme YgiQ (UPF0313 family)
LDVIGGIKDLYTRRGVKNFAFYDEALLYNPEGHIIRILEYILAEKIKANFYTPNGLHARFLTGDIAALLKQCNFIQPRLGFESLDFTRQDASGGKVYSDELEKAISMLRKAGYRSHEIGVYLLIGLPDQPSDEVEKSIRFLHGHGVRVYLEEYSPIPGTPYYESSGLAPDADPLLHNNSAFPLYDEERFREFQKLKALNHALNKQYENN